MRALQSITTAGFGRSGEWGRTEQFAALRYMSRYLETDAAAGLLQASGAPDSSASVSGGVGPSSVEERGWWGGTGRIGADRVEASPFSESVTAELPTAAQEAGALLEAMRFYNNRLADETLSSAEWSRCSAELALLRDRSCALMEQFLRGMRERDATGSLRQRGVRLEQGAAGWIAC